MQFIKEHMDYKVGCTFEKLKPLYVKQLNERNKWLANAR
jgi:hypothetical protein